MGGTAGMETGGSAGSETAGTAGTGGTGGDPNDPYAPRTGPFKMLVYFRAEVFAHTQSIDTGKVMVQDIAEEHGFEVTLTDTNEDINAEGLAQYEVVFFLNPTGDIFDPPEEAAFEDWMVNHRGGFVGVHSATDTETNWDFYKEVTGQYYDSHELCCHTENIQWDPDALDHPTVRGLPNPWPRSEEWYYFNAASQWSAQMGFKILSRVTSNNNTRPVSFIREWSNFRAFYTSLGHEGGVFQNAEVKKHVTAGILWAARREALLP